MPTVQQSQMRALVEAPVLEVFASIQGEGRYVGELMSFLRLRGCPLRCTWCDTPGSWTLHDPSAGTPGKPGARRPAKAVSARVATPDGTRREPAWATPFQAACWIAEVEPGQPRTLSVTGGEPLLWPEFLIELVRLTPSRRHHLETAGAHPRALARVLDAFEHVSLDLKLPADLEPPVPVAPADPARTRPVDEPVPTDEAAWAVARRACLGLLAGRDACAKLIVAGGREPRAFEPLLEDVARHAPGLPVCVQPVTPSAGVRAPDLGSVVALAELARDFELEVRVLPQVHRLLRVP